MNSLGDFMEGFDIQDALKLLAIGSGQDMIWNIMLYVIFFLGLITLFLIPDKNMFPTLLTAVVLLLAVVAKVSLASSDPILRKKEFGMMIINIGMAVLPFVVAGMIRSGKKPSKAPGPAILGGIIGMVYLFMFWFLQQQ
jgi:hypothetical protein